MPHKYDWSAIADDLRADPNQWHLIFEQDRSSVAHAVRQGSIAAVRPSDGFEVTTRNNTRGSPRLCDLYLMYVPPKRKRKR